MNTRYRIIDVQSHLFPQRYLEALAASARGSGRAAEVAAAALENPITTSDLISTGDIPRRLELMDAAGVDTQLLSFAAPNVWSDDVGERRRLAEAFNDGCADVVRDHPGRFATLATLPLPHVEASILEVDRVFDELDAVGVTLCTHIAGTPIDDARFEPLYAALSERRALVLLHPEGFFIPGALADYGMEWGLGAPFDDTIAAVRLIHGGVLDRHPNIRWIIPHLGGTLPFLARRLDLIWQHDSRAREQLAAEPTSYLRRLWFDTASPDPRTIALTAEVVGADRLLFGSDFPFWSRDDLGFGLGILERAGLDDRERRAIAGRTAAGLLGIGDIAT